LIYEGWFQSQVAYQSLSLNYAQVNVIEFKLTTEKCGNNRMQHAILRFDEHIHTENTDR